MIQLRVCALRHVISFISPDTFPYVALYGVTSFRAGDSDSMPIDNALQPADFGEQGGMHVVLIMAAYVYRHVHTAEAAEQYRAVHWFGVGGLRIL